MKVRIVWVGRTKNTGLATAIQNLSERIHHMAPFEVRELRQVRSANDRNRTRQEGERILASLGDDDVVIALDAEGRAMSSGQIADFLGRHRRGNPRDVVFVVGGPAGLSESVRQRADHMWSLSRLTFSHDLARTVLVEQIYRALSVLHNHPYAR